MKISQLPNGKWQASYYLGPKQRRVIHTNKKQLEALANKEIYDWHQKKITPEAYRQSITFAEACDKYLALYAIPNGQGHDHTTLAKFTEFFGAKTKLNEIDVERLTEFKAKELEKNSPASFLRRWTTLYAVFREAVNNGYLSKNPCKDINNKALRKKASRKNTARHRWFTNDETQRVYAELLKEPEPVKYANVQNNYMTPERREENMLYAVIARNTGLRPDSIEKLEWRDLNFKDNTLTARETKNSHTYILPMNTAARKAFLRLWEMRGQPQQGKVFRQAIWTRIFTKLFRRLGWNDSHLPESERKIATQDQAVLYSFRHTFASHLVMAGYAGKPLWDLMGWENGSEEATYSHLTPKFKETMANVVSLEYKSEGDKLLEEAKQLDGGTK